MRSRILPVAGISAAALACAMAFAPMAGAAGHSVGAAHKTPVNQLVHHARTAAACYAQHDNDNGIGIVSQNFEPSLDAFDAQGADTVKLSAKCKLKTVNADGVYFNGSGPADSFNVTFYKGKATPGATTKSCANASYTDSGFGSPVISCTAKLTKKTAKWVSVQANMNFSGGGEWGWNTNNTIRGKASQWENPGDGFGTGCTTYTTTTTCIPSGEGGDFAFGLNG
jgi:hypothetical protein